MTALPLRPDAKDHRGRRDAVSASASRSTARAQQMGLVAFIGILAALMTYRTGMVNRLESLDLQRAEAWRQCASRRRIRGTRKG